MELQIIICIVCLTKTSFTKHIIEKTLAYTLPGKPGVAQPYAQLVMPCITDFPSSERKFFVIHCF